MNDLLHERDFLNEIKNTLERIPFIYWNTLRSLIVQYATIK